MVYDGVSWSYLRTGEKKKKPETWAESEKLFLNKENQVKTAFESLFSFQILSELLQGVILAAQE